MRDSFGYDECLGTSLKSRRDLGVVVGIISPSTKSAYFMVAEHRGTQKTWETPARTYRESSSSVGWFPCI